MRLADLDQAEIDLIDDELMPASGQVEDALKDRQPMPEDRLTTVPSPTYSGALVGALFAEAKG